MIVCRRGEKLPPCTRRNVSYENICTQCNPDVGEEKKKNLTAPSHPPSIYVGETSKSLFERGKQHWKDLGAKQEDSHIYKHHQVHHGGRGEPTFHLRPVRFFKSALTRQIVEAVLIQRWGGDTVLNSKSEFNRSKIGRLTLGEGNKNWKPKEGVENELGGTEDTRDWEASRLIR